MPDSIDHDALFKLLLTSFFRKFLVLFAPHLETHLAPEQLVFLDKESFANLLDPDRREADLLVRGHLYGQATTFLIHLEHQAQPDVLLDRRMFRYFSRFYDFYNTPIYPIALCSYTTPRRPAPHWHEVVILEQTIFHFEYQVVQLNRLDWREFLQTANPIAAALMARMRIANADRWRVKAACMRSLAGQPLSGVQRRLIGQFVDQYLPLNAPQEALFRAEVATFRQPEQEVVMELVTSWERKARAEGRVEGRVEGQRRLVERQLARKCGALPADVAKSITNLSPTILEDLAVALLEFTNLADLRNWFANHALITEAMASSGEQKSIS